MDADDPSGDSLFVELEPPSSSSLLRDRPSELPLPPVSNPSTPPIARKRGRPPKLPTPLPSSPENSHPSLPHDEAPVQVSEQKKRGRPPKVQSPSRSLNSLEKKRRGRPRKNSGTLPFASSDTSEILKKKRGRPSLKPSAGISLALEGAAGHSDVSGIQKEKNTGSLINAIVLSPAAGSSDASDIKKKKRGRPRLKTDSHSNILKKKRGRPPKNSLYRLLELTSIKHKRGRPPNNYSTKFSSNLATVEAGETTVGAKPEDVHNRGAVGSSGKRRGRPSKNAVLFRNGNGITGNDGSEMPGKPNHSPDRTNFAQSGTHVKATLQSSMFCEEDVMMEEVVKRLPFMDTVVKVFCIHTEPNYSLPWQMKRQVSSNSSGFIIGGRRLLTNAHSVQNHTQVKVKKRGSDTKYLATVLAIGTECDIALLTVKDNEFWEGVSEVRFGALPALQDSVTVVGYPIGGDTISVTSGIVSRIEVTAYAHGATELLGVQIDAAINAGNSGGPAFNAKGQCVGIAFQALKQEDAENIGYIIPTPVISHFIDDYERNGQYTGFPILGIDWQKLENPDLRNSLGMEPHQKGVLVRRVEPTSPAAKCLQPTDIISSFDEIDVANDGTVPFRHGERIGFSYLVSQKFVGEKANVKILRDKKVLEFAIQLETHKRVVPIHIKGLPPSYFIIGGIVFVAVSVPYLYSEYGKDYNYDAPVKLLDKLLHSMAQSEDEQLVVISQVLVADINIGYEEIVNTQIITLNGVPVKNLKHLACMVENCEERFLKFDLEYDQILVLETKKAKEATLDILATHCIPSAASEDLK